MNQDLVDEPDIDEFVEDEYEPEPYLDGYLESYEGEPQWV